MNGRKGYKIYCEGCGWYERAAFSVQDETMQDCRIRFVWELRADGWAKVTCKDLRFKNNERVAALCPSCAEGGLGRKDWWQDLERTWLTVDQVYECRWDCCTNGEAPQPAAA